MNWFMQWASKLRDMDILSNTGSKVCGLGSLYQTWVRILIHRSFVTEWRSWLLCIMAISQYWKNGWRSLPKEQAVPIKWQTGPSAPSYFWMRWSKSIQGGTLPIGRSGAWFCWNKCSTMLQPCGIKSTKGAPKDSHQNQPKQPLSTLVCGP